MTDDLPPIVAVAFFTAPIVGAVQPDAAGHIIRHGELVMRMTDAAGNDTRHCSTCILHVQRGQELLR